MIKTLEEKSSIRLWLYHMQDYRRRRTYDDRKSQTDLFLMMLDIRVYIVVIWIEQCQIHFCTSLLKQTRTFF